MNNKNTDNLIKELNQLLYNKKKEDDLIKELEELLKKRYLTIKSKNSKI